MNYSESDIERELMSGETLKKLGYMPLWNQVRTEYGIIDILAINTNTSKLTVIELKKDTVDESAIGQILRYMITVQDLLEFEKENSKESFWEQIEGVGGLLIGDGCSPGVMQILRNLPSVEFYFHHTKLDVGLEPFVPCRQFGSVVKDEKWICENTDIIENLYTHFHCDNILPNK